jgi:hypothetical protein
MDKTKQKEQANAIGLRQLGQLMFSWCLERKSVLHVGQVSALSMRLGGIASKLKVPQ